MKALALPTGEVLTAADGAALVVVTGFALEAWDYEAPDDFDSLPLLLA